MDINNIISSSDSIPMLTATTTEEKDDTTIVTNDYIISNGDDDDNNEQSMTAEVINSNTGHDMKVDNNDDDGVEQQQQQQQHQNPDMNLNSLQQSHDDGNNNNLEENNSKNNGNNAILTNNNNNNDIWPISEAAEQQHHGDVDQSSRNINNNLVVQVTPKSRRSMNQQRIGSNANTTSTRTLSSLSLLRRKRSRSTATTTTTTTTNNNSNNSSDLSSEAVRVENSQYHNDHHIKQLQIHVRNEGLKLIDRLLHHLQQHPASIIKGISLPASAIGWLSSYIYPESFMEATDQTISSRSITMPKYSFSFRSRLSLLKVLLTRVTHLRITWSEEIWPTPLERHNSTRRTAGGNNDHHDIDDDELLFPMIMSRSSSTATASNIEEYNNYHFLDCYYQWKYSPRIDLRLFSNCQVLVIEQVPTRMIYHWDILQQSLQVLRIEKSCIYNTNHTISNHSFTSIFCTHFMNHHKTNIDSSSSSISTIRMDDNHNVNTNDNSDGVQSNNKDSFHHEIISNGVLSIGKEKKNGISLIKEDPLASPSPPPSNTDTNSQHYAQQHHQCNPNNRNNKLIFTSLTHIKISYCCLGEPIIHPIYDSEHQHQQQILNQTTIIPPSSSIIPHEVADQSEQGEAVVDKSEQQQQQQQDEAESGTCDSRRVHTQRRVIRRRRRRLQHDGQQQVIIPKLQSLCISHNQIVKERTALQGLSKFSYLSTLDLSYNFLTVLDKAYLRLGNIQQLILSHNQIRNTNGIDKLISLEILYLDYNQLNDLSSISGLSSLPQLKNIHLIGNPLEYNIFKKRNNNTSNSITERNSETGTTPSDADVATNGNRRNRRRNMLLRLIKNKTKKKLQSQSQHQSHQQSSSKSISVNKLRNKAYRVDVLNLFRERKMNSDVNTNTTYRDLQSILPILDGKQASLEELIALRERTFIPSTMNNNNMSSYLYSSQMDVDPSSQKEDENIVVIQNVKPTSSVIGDNYYYNNNKGNQHQQKKKRLKQQQHEAKSRASILDPLDTNVREETSVEPALMIGNANMNRNESTTVHYPLFSVADAVSSLLPSHNNNDIVAEQDTDDLELDFDKLVLNEDSKSEAIKITSAGGVRVNDLILRPKSDDGNLAVKYIEAAGMLYSKKIALANAQQKIIVANFSSKKKKSIPLIPLAARPCVFLTRHNPFEIVEEKKSSSMTLLHQEQEKQEDQSPSAEGVNIVDYTETQNEKMLSNGDGDDDDEHQCSLIQPDTKNVSSESIPATAVVSEDDSHISMEQTATIISNVVDHNSQMSVSSSSPSLAQRTLKHDSMVPPIDHITCKNNNNNDDFPDVLGLNGQAKKDRLSENNNQVKTTRSVMSQSYQDDDATILSNDTGTVLSTQRVAAVNITKRFLWAEDNSIFEGPKSYYDLVILDNLELYFRLFVFSKDIIVTTMKSGNDNETHVSNGTTQQQQQHPRIQLWPRDRQLRDAVVSYQEKSKSDFVETFQRSSSDNNNNVIGEEFRRVWKERVIPCGKNSLQRLTPNRVPRYSFHGELVWSTADPSNLQPENVVEHKEVIICLSNRAFYIIQGHDDATKENTVVPNNITPTASNGIKKNGKRKRFPLPIPIDARFHEAKWPHAVARHPFESLKAITIGFAFQRLTLHFSGSTWPTSWKNRQQVDNNDFTYILLVSNKLETVSILKEIQKLVTSCREDLFVNQSTTSIDDGSTIPIENDDRLVLDSMGIAVAPDIIDTVIHFQIVQQKWRRGDRGAVRRVFVCTDSKIHLFDEDYYRDGANYSNVPSTTTNDNNNILSQQQRDMMSLYDTTSLSSMIGGEPNYKLIDSATLEQISQVLAADADPNAITIVVKSLKQFQKSRNWRLLCRDGQSAEKLVEDVRKVINSR